MRNAMQRSPQLQSYGYNAFQTILWGLPQATMQIIFPLSGAYLARKLKNARCYVMAAYVSQGSRACQRSPRQG